MTLINWQDRISIDSEILAGKPVIKGSRVGVEFGVDFAEMDFQREAVEACLLYAREMLQEFPKVSYQ